MMISMVLVAVRQIMKKGQRDSSFILISSALILLIDILTQDGNQSVYVLVMDVMPSVAAMWLLGSTLSKTAMARRAVWAMALCNTALLMYPFLRRMGLVAEVTDAFAVAVSSVLAAMLGVLFLYGLSGRIGNVKKLIKNGNVWAVVCLIVDVVYISFVFAGVVLVQLDMPHVGVVILTGVMVATGYRMMNDSVFVFWHNQERIIAESMKVAVMQMPSDEAHVDAVYKELYERIVDYFESRKPYLDSELTIHAVVRDLYSNKLYISRSISQFTGRNFCQFVNYYRVMFSVESFRENPELKINELATLCGFNSIVSYNMAFRLFMGETPSEWCRKEKNRLVKSSK